MPHEKPPYAQHPRNFRDNHYVYPVISRRSSGLSVGINLNPHKTCNFNCAYCQVDRSVKPPAQKINLDLLRDELDNTLSQAVNGKLFDRPPFSHVPQKLRAINDIAFSGDGEPTTSPQFLDVVQIAADARSALNLDNTKLVLITNASCLNKTDVQRALKIMDKNNGEIWAKLDAGTEDHFRTINRSDISFQTILDNILEAARCRPVVIQSLWMNMHNSPPTDNQIDAFANRLKEITDRGGNIKLVQIYTIARQPAESYITPLTNKLLESIANHIKALLDIPISTFGQ